MDEHQDNSPDTTPADPAGDDRETVTITWRDLTFTVPKDRADWASEVQFEFEDGNRLRAMVILLGGGPAQAEGLAKFHATRGDVVKAAPTSGALNEFLTHAAEVMKKECVGDLW